MKYNKVLPNSLGTPRVWLLTTDGEDLRDYDGIPISKYLTEFEYEYNEEEDDKSNIQFEFPTLRSFDLPYFQQDVIMHVQWGYILPTSEIIKSPVRKIAVRDVKTTYSSGKISLELVCTDLVSYIKGFKTRTVRKYQKPNGDIADSAVNKTEDNFLDWLAEVSKGKFIPTLTIKASSQGVYSNGHARGSTYNPRTGETTVAIDNLRVRRDFYRQFNVAKVIKGKSQALSNAIDDKLKLLDAIDRRNAGNAGGPWIADSTDDKLNIKQRNFSQGIFRTYKFNGGNGELLSVSTSTNTRKIKEDKSVSSNIDPYTKKITKTEIASADTGINDRASKSDIKTQWEKFNDTETKNKPKNTAVVISKFEPSKIDLSQGANTPPTKEELKEYYKEGRKIFAWNIEHPDDQKELPPITYNRYVKADDVYMGKTPMKIIKHTIPAQEILNTPEFQSIKVEGKTEAKAQFRRENVLLGYTIEKIQRKYEATATVLGDPSLIKGKILKLENLGRLDTGLWYITSVKHKITRSSGYTSELELLRKPKQIGVDIRTYASQPKFDGEDLTFEQEYEFNGDNILFDDNSSDNMDYANDGSIAGSMASRLQQLAEDENYIIT